MKTPKILVVLGTAALVAGCTSTPSITDSVTDVRQLLAAGPSTDSAESSKLTEDQIRTLFVGNTVESHNRNTRLNSITYYHPNGQAVQQRLWSQRLGKWAIRNGQICLAFGDRSMKCRHIVKDGDRYFKVRPNKDGELEKIVRYRFFASGNLLRDAD